MAYAMSIWNQTGKQFACATEWKDYQVQRCPGKTFRDSDTSESWGLCQGVGGCVCVRAKAAYHTTYLLGDPVLRLFQYITSYPKYYSGSDGTHRYSDNPLGFWLLWKTFNFKASATWDHYYLEAFFSYFTKLK